MKTITMLLFCTAMLATSCKKDDNEPENPIDSLPPATQVGAQTFGCLVDGKAFLPGRFGQNVLSAYIQNIDGEYFFNLSAPSSEIRISMHADGISDLQEKQYELVSERPSVLFATFYKGLITDTDNYLETTTRANVPGRLTITNYDKELFIISGTFEFTVLDTSGKEIKVTDGRFDVNYTN